MRYLILNASEIELSRDSLCNKLLDEEFVVLGKLFLSALAIIDEEVLLQLQSKLLPHTLGLGPQSDPLVSNPSSYNIETDTDRVTRDQSYFLPSYTPYDQEMEYTTLEDDGADRCSETRLSEASKGSSSNSIQGFSDSRLSVCEEPEINHTRSSSSNRRSAMLDVFAHHDNDPMSANAKHTQISSPSLFESEIGSDTEAAPLHSRDTNRRSRSRNSTADESSTSSQSTTVEIGAMDIPPSEHDPESSRAKTGSSVQDESDSISARSPSTNSSQADDLRSTLAIAPEKPLSNDIIAKRVLATRYGGNTDCNLKPTDLERVMQAGDSFFREDALSFISSYLQESIWHEPILSTPPFDGPLKEKLYKAIQYSETLEQRSAADPLRLRIARVLLYWYYDQLCIGIRTNQTTRRSRGRDTASIALDTIFEEIYPPQENVDPQVKKRRRIALQKHKQIGRRWTMLITCVGAGVLLVCTPELAAQINNGAFSEGMIHAFINYVINLYPEAVKICKVLHSLSICMLKGELLEEDWLGTDNLQMLNSYSHKHEKETYEFIQDWQFIEVPTSLPPDFFSQ